MIGYSKKLFQDNNVVIITTDDYKPFHPKANEIARKFPTKYSSIVEQDSALWTNKVLHEAMKKKYNFIFEVTFRNERILSTIQELKEQGFNVIIRGLAVPELESLLTLHMPAIRNGLVMLLSSKNFDELQTEEGKETLRAEALEIIRGQLQKEREALIASGNGDKVSSANVEQVLFTNFVMQ